MPEHRITLMARIDMDPEAVNETWVKEYLKGRISDMFWERLDECLIFGSKEIDGAADGYNNKRLYYGSVEIVTNSKED